MLRMRFSRLAFVGIVSVVLILMPVFTQQAYFFHILITVSLQILLVSGVRLMMTVGQVSLAQGAFMGIGAYASALLVMRTGVPFFLALPAAGTIAGALAVVVGYPMLRVKGVYFFIVTFALGEVLRLTWVRWTGLFGGMAGLASIPAPSPIRVPWLGTVNFSSKVSYYYLILVILFVALLAFYSLSRSRIGRILGSIHDAETLSEAVGINVMSYKVLAFVVAGFFAGIAGSFYAHYSHYINPEDFTFVVSMYAVIYAAVGGSAAVAGPILGCSVLIGMSESLRGFREYIPLAYGAILIAVAMLFPTGFYGLWKLVSARFAFKKMLRSKRLQHG